MHRESAQLCVWGLQRLQRREFLSQCTFPVKWQEQCSQPTLPDAWGRTAKCGRTACSSSPSGMSAAPAESRHGSESVSTRSPRPQKESAHSRRVPHDVCVHTSVHTLPVSHSLTRSLARSLNQVFHVKHGASQNTAQCARKHQRARAALAHTQECRTA